MSSVGRSTTPQRLSRAVREFLHTEAAGGFVLIAAALAALVWANSPWHGGYDRLWHTELRIEVGNWGIAEDLRHWVNDGLMALFFFVVGLEVKRELVSGELRTWRTAAVPVVAAVGGMVVPALVYVGVNLGQPGARGWGIPMATDIAFALGVLAVVGRRAHPALKLFLLTLAVADDIGAILVIALFYAGDINLAWLGAAAALIVLLIAMRRLGVHALAPAVLVGLAVWVAVFESGVHATIAGVALGLLTPAQPSHPDVVVRGWARDLVEEPTPGDMQELRRVAKSGESLVERLELALHPWTSFVIVPVFALANSGVRFTGLDLDGPGAVQVAAGTALALVAGKLIGIFGATWLAVRSGVGTLPEGLGWRDVAGGAACGGIGFTVSLFIAGLAFDEQYLVDAAKVGILVASLAATAVAAAVLARRSSGARDLET